MNTREATDQDREAIKLVHLDAFGEVEGPVVAKLALDLLTDETAQPVLALVAEERGAVVGSIVFSSVTIRGHEDLVAYILAPLAVAQAAQGRGFGRALIGHGISMHDRRTRRGPGARSGEPSLLHSFRLQFGARHTASIRIGASASVDGQGDQTRGAREGEGSSCLPSILESAGALVEWPTVKVSARGAVGSSRFAASQEAHENGDVEQAHHRFKQAVDQALRARGSRDFADRASYVAWLQELTRKRNQTRQLRWATERDTLRPLPASPLPPCRDLPVTVTRGCCTWPLSRARPMSLRLWRFWPGAATRRPLRRCASWCGVGSRRRFRGSASRRSISGCTTRCWRRGALVTNRHEVLTQLLQRVQLHHTAAEVDDLAVRAAREGLSHLAFLQAFVEQEVSYREQRRFERLLRDSRLPREQPLAQLDLNWFGLVLAQQIEWLQRGAFVTETANVIAVGKPGTGKSHLAAAIGHRLIRQGHTVLWTSTAALVQQLLAARRDLRLPRELARPPAMERSNCHQGKESSVA